MRPKKSIEALPGFIKTPSNLTTTTPLPGRGERTSDGYIPDL